MDTHDHGEESRLRHYKDISLVDLYHNLQRQGDSVGEIKKQLEPLAELATQVKLLAQQMQNFHDDIGHVDALRTQVTIHQTVHWLVAGICGLVFPVLVTWNFQLNADIRKLQSELDASKEKIHALERVTYTKQP